VIFRKVSLERLSSPEQLDQLVQVTDPRGWLALIGLGSLVLAGLGWGVYGSIPTAATGEGILLRRGGVSDLVSAAAGQVEDVLVAVGDEIEKGQPVARLRQDALTRQIADNRSKLAAEERELASLRHSTEEQKRLRARDLELERRGLERTIAALEVDVRLLGERLEAERALLDDGLITKQTFLTTQQNQNAKQDELASRRLALAGLELKRLEGERQLDQQVEARETVRRNLELETGELTAKLGDNVAVLSPFSGRVLEVLTARGDVVAPGAALLSVEVLSEDLMAVLFVPASAGKTVKPGMAVRVAPSTVRREEFGTLLGTVEWVAEFPATARGMTRLLGNEALVTKLLEQGPPIQVNVALTRDAATASGYRWSSSRGPDLAITSGTLAAGDVVVKEERPLALVVPALKEALGLR
jgi:HlyD family secretion protein